MKDADVRKALKKAGIVSFSVSISEPYRHSHGVTYRMYDKVYRTPNFAVFAEAELGKKLGFDLGQDRYAPVTVKDNRAYEKERKRCITGAKAVALRESMPSFRTGPLVTRPDDGQLETINIINVLVQYDGLGLNNFKSPEWIAFIKAVAEKYDAGLWLKNDGYVSVEEERCHGLSADGMPSAPEIVFQHYGVVEADQLEPAIIGVYNAGTALRRAVDGRAQELIDRYLTGLKK